MSIPPLVCSTPPPLEQIESEDDIGQDDFAVQYGLSQDDEEDFCTYENYQTTILASPYHVEEEKKTSNSSVLPEQIDTDYVNTECEKKSDNILLTKTKTTVDEDNNIEDLDLKFEPVSTKPINKDNSPNEKTVIEHSDELQSSSVIFNEKANDNEIAVNLNTECTKRSTSPIVPAEEIVGEKNIEENNPSANTSHTQSSGSELTRDGSLEKEEDFNDFQFIPTELNLEQEVLGDLGFHQASNSLQGELVKQEDITILTDDEDFNDFDTFQLGCSTVSKIESVNSGSDHNPWKSHDTPPIKDFSDFQASFEDNLCPVEKESSNKIDHNFQIKNENDDDDFGDFDDFKCSNSAPATNDTETNQGLSIKTFDFKNTDNESQIYESIEKLIHSLYENDIVENEDSFECSLESSLCETWGHLTETEVRQPYMVNWNNSIAQKTLLKSLCIDSRNILFGPKWNNMPRYAANLGPAPLQPLKPSPAAAVSALASNATSHSEGDKSTSSKTIESWSESLANEGQESCNDAEKSSNSRVKSSIPTPRELEQKVRPSTLPSGMTPMQINLPDTHIFTPTDSEVPRSKTIHNFTPIAPQILQETSDKKDSLFTNNLNNNGASSSLENEYDDFQDFQDNSSRQLPQSNVSRAPPIADTNQSINKVPSVPNAITYQTQTILEPIKLNPVVPELNWPEPGEVKETFDDFTDFVSNSTWSNLHTTGQNVTKPNVTNSDSEQNKLPPSTENEKTSQSFKAPPTMTVVNNQEPLDDCDNFQFVPAGSSKLKEEILPQTETFSNQPSTHINLPQINGLLSPMVPLKMQSTPIPPPKSLAPTSQILQPMPYDQQNYSSQDKANTQQILQPLSLESFSQINWPSPGVDLQDLSRFNPIHAVRSLHQSPSGSDSKSGSPARSHKGNHQEDDGWGDFVSIKPSKSPNHAAAKPAADDDDWSDFVCASKPNGLNTISFNVHTNLSAQKPYAPSRPPADRNRADVPNLNYITPKTTHRSGRDGHFQNL